MGAGFPQIGEFSFILVQVARSAGHVSGDVYNATLAASLISIVINIVINTVLVRWAPSRLPSTRWSQTDVGRA